MMVMIEKPVVARSQRIQSPKEASAGPLYGHAASQTTPSFRKNLSQLIVKPPDIVRVAEQPERPDDQAKTNSESSRSVM
jgi:hypothetical protein